MARTTLESGSPGLEGHNGLKVHWFIHYVLNSETCHGTIASINLPQFRQCHADTEEDEEKS